MHLRAGSYLSHSIYCFGIAFCCTHLPCDTAKCHRCITFISCVAALVTLTLTTQAATASLQCMSNAHSHPYTCVRVKAMQRTQSSKTTSHVFCYSTEAPAKLYMSTDRESYFAAGVQSTHSHAPSLHNSWQSWHTWLRWWFAALSVTSRSCCSSTPRLHC